MKKSKFTLFATIALLFSATISAQESSKETIYIKTARFAEPLVEEWVLEYNKYNPQIEIKIADRNSNDEDVSINLINSDIEKYNDEKGRVSYYAGRYAILPISNSNNPFLAELGRKGLQEKKLESLFFEKELFDSTPSSSKKEKYVATIYSGTNEHSFARSFASHFGYSPVSIKGRKISGDDLFLIQAIQKDNSGITFNNLSYIFNVETRGLKDGLALIPLDVKKQQREVLEEGNIDKILELLEQEDISLIPVEGIVFTYHNDNLSAKSFLRWVLSEGQEYNHKHGFLKADKEVALAQLKSIEESLLTASHK